LRQRDRVRGPLTRDLCRFDITVIGVGGMNGAGIPMLTGIGAARTGPALPVVSLVNGTIALVTAASCAGLAPALSAADGGSPVPSRRRWPASAARRSS
jgi:amino acid transporter